MSQSRVIISKTFIDALIDFDLKKVKKCLNDKRPTLHEKTILKAWLLLRDNKFNEIIAMLETITTSHNDLVESQRCLLMGIVLNNMGDSHQAVSYLKQSLELQKDFDLKRLDFVAYDNLFLTYYNLKRAKDMAWVLDELETIKVNKIFEKISMRRNKVLFLLFTDNLQKALVHLRWLEKQKEGMTESQLVTHEIIRFNYFIKANQISECRRVIANLKKYRKFNYGANFKFMSRLLENLLDDAPLYVYDKDFSGHPNLYNQIMVLKSLEEGDKAQAQVHWQQLREASPDTYQEDFQYKGDVCLFSLCLDKHIFKKVNLGSLAQGETKEEKLISLLTSVEWPLSREEVYEAIWGELAQDKSSFDKLNLLIYRVRQKTGFEIYSRKGCLSIKTPSKKKSA